jgi:type IV secretion system protein VirD4
LLPGLAERQAGQIYPSRSAMRKLSAIAARLLLVMAIVILLADAAIVGLRYQAYAIIVLIGITYRLTRRRWQVSDAYGSARFADLNDLLAGRLVSDQGLIVGRLNRVARPSKGQALRWLLSPRQRSEDAIRLCLAAFGSRRLDDFIRINDGVHFLTVSPAGGGKSVSTIAPNLLSYKGNCVVMDPKGELFKLTADHRKNRFGHTIVRLDPARQGGPGGDCFNPLDWIDPSRPDFIDICRDLANMIVVRSGKELDPHWCDSAENVI